MSTEIQWTDETWNPVTGCTKVSPGCAHCYAEGVAERFWAKQYPPIEIEDGTGGHRSRIREFTDVQTHADRLDQPLRWKKPRKVFVNSMSDLFHEDVPDQFIVDVFGIIALAHWHTFQVLTKRADRMRKFLDAGDHGILRQFMLLQQNGGTSTRNVFRALDVKRRDNIEWRWPLPNVWLGVSVENQHFADERIPLLLQTPAAVRFISAEPLLGPIDLLGMTTDPPNSGLALTDGFGRVDGETDPSLHWVIVGGESGAGARPFDVQWGRSIVQQCQAAGVPVFVKQLGANPRQRVMYGPPTFESDQAVHVKELCLKSKKGGDMAEWPADLRIREFPAPPPASSERP